MHKHTYDDILNLFIENNSYFKQLSIIINVIRVKKRTKVCKYNTL